MRRRPLIGVTTQTLHAIEGIPEALPSSWVMNQRYVHAVMESGGVPVLVPLLAEDPATLRAIYERLDGVLVPGGIDVDPAYYRANRHEGLGRLDPARDTTEVILTRWALQDTKPFLGLCRGLQILNVALGGSLWQDLEAEREGSLKHDYFPTAGWERDHLAHDIDIVRSSRLGDALGATSAPVNSMHHQGIKAPGFRLTPTAWAPDGLIEAGEVENQFAVGVQWHPEMFHPGAPSVGRLFGAFVDAAARDTEARLA
ncbi:MAG TPA: gamma-glutamyl-gamma-aminobutyrate hydrolase family protein [Gemmatimonadales bacterium]|nr:gamma-glutamyl-gamma-aminobutyrate hydrolase family protein [Gemmatimonadales bacterium]